MGTSSLTYVYNSNGKVIMIMYRQYDGDPTVHGYELSEFLKYNQKVDLEHLSNKLFSYFFKREGSIQSIEIVPLDSIYFWIHDYQYHIYYDKVKILGMEKDIEVNWK